MIVALSNTIRLNDLFQLQHTPGQDLLIGIRHELYSGIGTCVKQHGPYTTDTAHGENRPNVDDLVAPHSGHCQKLSDWIW